MGGPFADYSGSLIVLENVGEDEARELVAADPFIVNGVLVLEDVRAWNVYVDELTPRSSRSERALLPARAVKIPDVDEKPRRRGGDVESAASASGAPLVAAERPLGAGVDPRAVVLVEGISDRVALEALAERRGRDLAAEGVAVVPIGGAQAIERFLHLFGRRGLDVRLAGLCDAAEEGDFRRGLERAGLGSDLTRADMEALGFYVCVADLEDELIRALGAPAVERVVDTQGDLGSFRTLQKQPAWHGRSTEEQLRRFMGSGGSRKIRYARLLVDALDLSRVPRPLDLVLSHV